MDRQLLARATDSSDAPTPGYMYLDIAKNAASNPSTCNDVAQFLTRRLSSKNNANIKFKCLKVIAKTAESPYLRGQFKRCLAQDPSAMSCIKEALQYRGPPDPVRGDQPYARVRDTAKEALDAIYSDAPPAEAVSSAPQGFGGGGGPSISSAAGYQPSPHQQQSYGGAPSGGPGGGGGGRRMEGIGNPMFKDPRLDPQPAGIANMTVQEAVQEAKETIVGMIRDPLARNVEVHSSNRTGSMPRPGGGYQGGGVSSSYGYPPGRSELMNQTNGQWTMKSNRGPDALQPPPNFDRDAAYFKARDNSAGYSWAQREGAGSAAGSGGVGGSWASGPSVASQARQQSYPHSSQPYQGGVTSSSGGGGTAISDGSYEKQLITELCPPGGMKAEPPQDKLAQFSRIVANLNADFVCPALLDSLEEGQPWIIRAKALCVIEASIKNGQKPHESNNPYADFFHACKEEIEPLTSHARVAVRDPAKRVLSLLGVEGVGEAAASVPVRTSARPPAAAQAPAPNLLDFDDEPAPAPAASAPAPSAGGGDSLFGGLKVQNGPSAAAPSAAPAATAASARSTDGFLLDDLMSGSATTASGTAPVPAPAVSSGGGGLFGNMNVKGSTPAPVAPTPSQAADMFSNLSVKGSETVPAQKSENVTSVAAGGSAFGFMNGGDAKPAEIPAPAPAVPDKASFDPLLKVTPNTAKQMMQISPEQMQAMAYQQMMMQQQMQMQMMMQQQQQQRRSSHNVPPVGGMPMAMPMVGNMVPAMRNPATARPGLSFLDGKPQRKDDKSFDFIKDTMFMEKKK